MKKREIFLDFTSLLDIIMILLFFFIMFSSMETDAAQEKARYAESNAIAISEEANKKINEAEQLKKEAEEALHSLKEENSNSASHLEGLNEFNKSENLNFVLDISEGNDNYNILLYKGGDELDCISDIIPNKRQNRDLNYMKSKEKQIGELIITSLEENGFSDERTLICNFIYNSNINGTNSVYKIIYNSFDNYIKRKYNNLYVSYIDEGKIRYD